MKSFQDIVLSLEKYWAGRGCRIVHPYDIEKGAGTFNPHTFLRCLGTKPWNCAYVEPCRRPTDGRYGENPNRLCRYYQYQVLLKPSPKDVQTRYLHSLKQVGLDPKKHDIRFVEDDWESPTLGASGVGWEVWCDGLEITQFTYFQQVGGIPLSVIPVEITYGLERIAMYVQGKDSVFEVVWADGTTYGDLHKAEEVEFSRYNFEEADVDACRAEFNRHEEECRRLLARGLVFPAYDAAMKCSHLFNLLEARGAISVADRAGLIGRIRALTRQIAETWLQKYG